MAERLGANGRGCSYECTGALRDVIQNHLLPQREDARTSWPWFRLKRLKWLADVTRANENIPTRHHPVKTKLEE